MQGWDTFQCPLLIGGLEAGGHEDVTLLTFYVGICLCKGEKQVGLMLYRALKKAQSLPKILKGCFGPVSGYEPQCVRISAVQRSKPSDFSVPYPLRKAIASFPTWKSIRHSVKNQNLVDNLI